MPWSAKARLQYFFRVLLRPFVFASVLLVCAESVIFGQSGVSQEGNLTVFRTGGSNPLVSLMMPLAAPPTNVAPLLQFEFGFETDETNAPDSFFDSLSVTVQGSDPAQSALLLTADQSGVTWDPVNPGGIAVDPAQVQHQAISPANVDPKLALRVAYSVSFILPAVLLGRPIKVFFDLFDNLNGTNSVAYVTNLRLPTGIRLQSALSPNGPFVDENGAVSDEVKSLFTLDNSPTNRFFRIVGARTLRIIEIKTIGNQLAVSYAPVQLKVESASEIKGNFAEESGAVLDEVNRAFTVTPTGGNRFYRIASDVKSRLKAPRLNGNQIVLEYEFNP